MVQRYSASSSNRSPTKGTAAYYGPSGMVSTSSAPVNTRPHGYSSSKSNLDHEKRIQRTNFSGTFKNKAGASPLKYVATSGSNKVASSGGGGGGFHNSVVFLKKKTAQAVLLQAHVRGFLARKKYKEAIKSFRREQKKRQKRQQRLMLVLRLQAIVRGFLCRRQCARLVRQSRAIVPLQALVRAVVQRSRWTTFQQLELRLLQIQRHEQQDLETIQDNKMTQMRALDQQVEDFHKQQRHIVKETKVMGEKNQTQEAIKDHLRKENKKLRDKIDALTREGRAIKAHDVQLRKTIHMAYQNFKPQLEAKIAELETSIQKLEASLSKLEQVETKAHEKLDTVTEKLTSEYRQAETYTQFVKRLIQKVQQQCPEDRFLYARCMALAKGDKVSLRVIDLESRLCDCKDKTKADLRAIRHWKREQLQKAHDQVQQEFQDAYEGHRLYRRHIQEYAVWLKRHYRRCQRQTEDRAKIVRALMQTNDKNNQQNKPSPEEWSWAQDPTNKLQYENSKLQAMQQKAAKQLDDLQRAYQTKQKKLEHFAAKESMERHLQDQLNSSIQTILQAVQERYSTVDGGKLMKRLQRVIKKSPLAAIKPSIVGN